MIHNTALSISIRDPSLLISSFGNLSISQPVSSIIAEPSVPVEILLVDQDSAKELTCAICLQLLSNPQQCKNGHLFCFSCISQYIERNPECPHCRCSLKESELSRSLFVEKHIQLLRVWCKYHFKREADSYDDEDWIPDEAGCPQNFPLEFASKHEKSCTFSWGVCKYCRLSTLRKKDLSSHESSCPARPSECPHCLSLFESSKLQHHLLECEMVPVVCSQCGLSIRKPDYERHLDRECLECLIVCPFREYGCEEKILRKNVNQHLNENPGFHMLKMKQFCDDEIFFLKQSFESQIHDKEERIKQLEKQIADRSNFQVEWKIKNWTTSKRKSYLSSDKFSIGDFTWFFGLYPDGDNDESKGYISIYLFADLTSLPKGKFISLDFDIILVNPTNPRNTLKKDFTTIFPVKGGQGWGDRKTIKASKIEDDGFLKQDTLTVSAVMTVKKTHMLIH